MANSMKRLYRKKCKKENSTVAIVELDMSPETEKR